MRLIYDANLRYPFRNRQLEVKQLSHGFRRGRRALAAAVREPCLRCVPASRMHRLLARRARPGARACSNMASIDALRAPTSAATRLSGKPAVLRCAALPRRAGKPLKCAFRDPDAFSQPPPEAAAVHSCPYAELGASCPGGHVSTLSAAARFFGVTRSSARGARLHSAPRSKLVWHRGP